jgi:hypothetical protein
MDGFGPEWMRDRSNAAAGTDMLLSTAPVSTLMHIRLDDIETRETSVETARKGRYTYESVDEYGLALLSSHLVTMWVCGEGVSRVKK